MLQRKPHPKSISFLAAIITLVLWNKASAQVSWSASLIPDSLKAHAHSVIRSEEETFTVYSPSKAVDKVHKVVTVLDEEGRNELEFAQGSNSFMKLDEAEINVYNDKGIPLQHIKQKQMVTEAYGDGLIEDGATTFFDISAPNYPITVEYNYTLDLKGTEGYTEFELDNTEKAIESSQLTLIIPSNMTFRYHNHRLALQPTTADADKNNKSYTWKVAGIKAVAKEKRRPSDAIPAVWLAPNQFEMAGFPGDMSTWKQFGQWLYDLNKDTYTLPDASKTFYQQLVAGASSDEDKARILYNYLQKNFRYVSIQLGIGGQRSFPAAFTEKKKYGDCKALSTYMKACLDAVGVKSYTAVINAGNNEPAVDASFPVDHFNHVILCIPHQKDTTWLECTSKHTDFGILSGFTENRNALLITENGGFLVRTPSSSAQENQSFTHTLVHLTADGSGTAEVHRSTTGELKFEDLELFNDQEKEKQKRYLMEFLDYGQPDAFSVTFGGTDSIQLHSDLNLTFEKIPEFTSGDKMFLNPRLYHIWYQPIASDSARSNDYYVYDFPFTKSDTTCYQLPEGYTVDDLPQGIKISCPFASYQSSYYYDQAHKSVYSYVQLSLNTTKVPAKDFSSIYHFLDQIFTDQNEKIVINKQ
jgi:hypothetical protein